MGLTNEGLQMRGYKEGVTNKGLQIRGLGLEPCFVRSKTPEL